MKRSPATRWRKLSDSTQWRVLYGLGSDIIRREYVLSGRYTRSDGFSVNKAKRALASDRAVFDVLRSVTEPDVLREVDDDLDALRKI